MMLRYHADRDVNAYCAHVASLEARTDDPHPIQVDSGELAHILL